MPALKSHALALFGSDWPAEALRRELTRRLRAAPTAKRPGRQVARSPAPLRRLLAHLRFQRKPVL